jgi:hypothetical protein
MFQLSQTLVALKRVVLRGVARHSEVKLPSVEADIVEGKKDLMSTPWLTLGPMVCPDQLADEGTVVSRAPAASALISKSSDLLPCASSPASSATPGQSISSEDNISTVTTLSMPPPPVPEIVVSDYDGGRRFDIEREDEDMLLKKTAMVSQLSEPDANTQVGEDPKTLGFLAPPAAVRVLKRKKCPKPTRVIPSEATGMWGCIDVCIELFGVPISSEGNSSTVTVSMPLPSVPDTIVSYYDGEKAGRGFDKEQEHRDMFLKLLKETAEVRRLSEAHVNTLVGEDPEKLRFVAPAGDSPSLKRTKRVTPRRAPEPWGRADVCIALFTSTDICS